MKFVKIESIWLNRDGIENDPHAKASVLVKLAQEDFYREVIAEPIGDNFSHAVHGDAIANSPVAVRFDNGGAIDRLQEIEYRLRRESDPNTSADEKLESGATSDWVLYAESDMRWLIDEVRSLREKLTRAA